MPKNICIDLNVVLDFILGRATHIECEEILELGEQGRLKLHISAHLVTTLAYLLEKEKKSKKEIDKTIYWLIGLCHIVPTDEHVLTNALGSRVKDYEDAVVEQAALAAKADFIVTNNTKDFARSFVPAQTPRQYLSKIK